MSNIGSDLGSLVGLGSSGLGGNKGGSITPGIDPSQADIIKQNVAASGNQYAQLGLGNSTMAQQDAAGMSARQFGGFEQQNIQDQIAAAGLNAQLNQQLTGALGNLGGAIGGLVA